MKAFILGTKETQSQQFNEQGQRIPTTQVNTSPCYLVDILTTEKQGYNAIKVGFGKARLISKPTKGLLTKAGIETPLRFIRESRFSPGVDFEVIEENGKRGIQKGDVKVFIGEEIKVSSFFKKGDKVHVQGTSIGKGFQGAMRRHGFAGGPKTHGQSDRARAPGSIGQRMTPGRVFKGMRMAGRMGGVTIKVKNLVVQDVNDLGLTLKGLVPGKQSTILEITLP